MVTARAPTVLPQPLLVAEIVFVPAVVQVIEIVLPVLLPVPPPVFQLQPELDGVQLVAVAV